jgi:hypothetical protein
MQIQQIDLKKLKPWEKNPRINDHAVESVAESISAFGFNVPILCDPQFTIIAGHTRWKAAKKLQLETVPVVILELTEAQRKAYSIADNKTAEIARWDFPELRNILDELVKAEIDLPTGFSQAELDAILESNTPDFDWSAFDGESFLPHDPNHVRLLVKIPPATKKPLEKAILCTAKTLDLSHNDNAVLAGLVFQKLLENFNGCES